MNVLGIRCSNSDFAFAVVVGKKNAPKLLKAGLVAYPKGFDTPNTLKWLLQELTSLGTTFSITHWAVKGAEPMAARDKAFVSRVECEAMVYLAAANAGLANVVRRVKPTIAKALGLQGKASALKDLDLSVVDGYYPLSEKELEALLVAWSELQ